MKSKNAYFLQYLLCLVCMMGACKKEDPEVNLSTFSSLSVDTRDAVIPSYIIDQTGNYLLVCIRDLNYSNSIIKKINLSTLKVEKEIKITGTVPISLSNILLTDNNEMVSTFYNFDAGTMIIYKFDMNLNVVKKDITPVVGGGNLGRRRMVKAGPNRIIGVETYLHTSTGQFYLRYMTMDDNLTILNERTDTSEEYGNAFILPEQFIRTNDGGTLYVGDNIDEPLYLNEIILEKRDASFNVKWRAKYKSDVNVSASCVKEYNGSYYVWASNEDYGYFGNGKGLYGRVFMLIYDQQGNLIREITMPNEAKINVDAENIVITDDGDFLMVARSTLNSTSDVFKGLLFHANASMDNITYKSYGGEREVQVSDLIRMESDRYLLMYLDRSFTPDGVQPRLVFRYVDAKGNFIE
jgi:hypothetical protein